MKPGRFNGFLLIGILLVAAAYYGLNQREKMYRPQAGLSATLFPFEPQSLRELRIESNAYALEIQRENGTWQLTSPVNDLASAQRIYAFLNALSQITVTPVAGLNLETVSSQYGTEPPLWKLEFSDGYEQTSLLIGQDLPVGDGTYIRFPKDKRLYVTSTSIKPHLPNSFEVFRDLSLLNGNLENVKRIEHVFGEQSIEARKEDALSWTLVKPYTGRGNRTRIEDLIQTLLTLDMSGVAADRVSDPGVYGIDNNSRMLRVEWTDKPSQTVRIGSREAGADTLYVHISGRDSIYTLPEGKMDFLNRISPVELRDKRPLSASPEALQSILIQHPDFSTHLFRTQANWKVKGAREQDALSKKVDALITLWTAPVIESFAPQISSTNRPPSDAVVRMEFEAKSETESLGKWIFEAPLDELNQPLVKTLSVSDQEWIYIPSALLNPSALRPINFYKPVLWTFPIEKTQSLAYGPHQSTSLIRVDEPALAPVISILQSIKPLSIADENPDMMPAGYFSEDTQKLVFKLPAEDGISKTLLLGNLTQEGNQFVKLLGNPLVYLVDHSVLQTAIRSLEKSSAKSE